MAKNRYRMLFPPVFSGLAFLILFVLNYHFGGAIHDNLTSLLTGDSQNYISSYDSDRWYGQIHVVRLLGYNREYAIMTSYGTIAMWTCVVIGLSVSLAWLTHFSVVRNSQWLIASVCCLYVFIPFLASRFYPDMCGIQTISFIYATLIYIMRALLFFDPHLPCHPPRQKPRIELIVNLYQQYFLASLAVTGFVCGSILLGMHGVLRQQFQDTASIFQATIWPYTFAYIGYSIVGVLGLGFGIAKEFVLKQQEALAIDE